MTSTKKFTKNNNLNYLFHYRSWEEDRELYFQEKKINLKRKTKKLEPFIKERFVQANYRFIVSDYENFELNLKEPDLLVSWEHIEQVYMYTHTPYHCPICWEHPIAAKISKCGHVFCWSCIIRYLSYTEKNIGKCPICFEYINLKDLKSILVVNIRSYIEGNIIKFTLLKRSKNSIIPLPGSNWNEKLERYPMSTDKNTIFCRFTITNNISDILERESKELEEAAKQAIKENDDSLPFILIAQEKLQERNIQENNKKLENKKHNSENIFKIKYFHQKDDNSISDKNEKKDLSQDLSNKNISSNKILNFNGKLNESLDNFFYMYQANDTQQLFLHPLNMKILLKEYGNFENLPEYIEGKILEIENYIQSETLRKQYRFLNHLPLSSSFQFVEIDMRPLVSWESIKPFYDDIKKRIIRRKEQKRKIIEEKKLEELLENQKKESILNEKDFPTPKLDERCISNFHNEIQNHDNDSINSFTSLKDVYIEINDVNNNDFPSIETQKSNLKDFKYDLSMTNDNKEEIPKENNNNEENKNLSQQNNKLSFLEAVKTPKHFTLPKNAILKKKTKKGKEFILLSTNSLRKY